MSAKNPRAYLVLLVKNAEKDIIDWLSWHLTFGFQRIIIVDAGSDDGTKDIVQKFEKTWPVKWFSPSLVSETGPQEKRLGLIKQAIESLFDKGGWMLCLDIDEYFCPDSTLANILKCRAKTKAIALNWCIFGANNHRERPKGHIVTAHPWRADISFPDHKFVKLFVRLSAIIHTNKINDPVTYNLLPSEWETASGKPYSPQTDVTWEGGRILHYVCSNYDKTSSENTLDHILQRYYNRSDIKDTYGYRHLGATRQIKARLLETLFAAGLTQFEALIDAYKLDIKNSTIRDDDDLTLPDEATRFGFSYRRIRLNKEESLLLSKQAFPPADTTRIWLLRTNNNKYLLTDSNEHEKASLLLCVTQDRYPRLLTLISIDNNKFQLGDINCSEGLAVVPTAPTYRSNIVTLPKESGHDRLFYEMLPSPQNVVPYFLPLPVCNEQQGLSLEGLFEWLATHPEAQHHDIRRGFFLLTQKDAKLLGKLIPALQPFLP
ncbi:glycosyltransferase family 2 protein [Aristophania vespae]|uniref:glycosyltransferase family 2 protein n=1 Tax=Aristophania vespae TaxID=2697033 RepID=UPI0023512C0C|nr:glycosyltransferase family 2 protein [Aristophania vespae]UMM64333.1 hypothetical protein DM15PD_13460 [Aristophania vespae]